MEEKCPRCGEKLIKTPQGRFIEYKLSSISHVENKYSFKCLKCKYEKTKII